MSAAPEVFDRACANSDRPRSEHRGSELPCPGTPGSRYSRPGSDGAATRVRKPAPPRKCRYCARPPAEHGALHECPDGSGLKFGLTVKGEHSASNSFPESQLTAVARLLVKARSIPELAVMMRSPDLVAFERKVTGMRKTIQKRIEEASTSNGGDHG